MERILKIFRRYISPELCFRCRKKMEVKMLDLKYLRQKEKEIRPKITALQKAASGLCDELLKLSPEKRRKKIQFTRYRLRSRPLAEELLRRSLDRVHFDSRESIHLAELAFEVTLTLFDPEAAELSGGMTGIADTQALAMAYQANGYRVACDHESAANYFAVAERHLQRSSGDPLVTAEIFCLKASFFQTRKLLPMAMNLLDRAEEIYSALDEEHFRGLVLVKKASVSAESGNLQGALRAHLESCSCIDAVRDPQLSASAFHNLALTYCNLGQFEDASTVLADSEEFFLETVEAGSTLHLYRQWTLAKVAKGLEQFEVAEVLFIETSEGFEALEISYNVALVLLDLAELYTVQARVDDVAAIAEQTYAALEAHNLHREAAHALMIFITAARRREVHLSTIRNVAELLQRYRHCKVIPS